MVSKTYKMTIADIKDSDGWHELAHSLGIEDKMSEYFAYGEYGSIEIEVDQNMNIVGGKILKK